MEVVNSGYFDILSTEGVLSQNATPIPFEETTTSRLDYAIALKCVVVGACIGCLANGFVFFLLISDKHLRKCSSLFFVKFQIGFDFLSCLTLIISDTLKLVLNGDGTTMKRWGNVICILFIGDGLIYTVLSCATTNLGVIAFERYMKIVHSVKHRKYFRKWMFYVAILFVVTSSILINLPMTWTSVIDDQGNCWPFETWPSQQSLQAYTISVALWSYVFLLIELIYCYARIVLKLRQKGSIAPEKSESHQPTSNSHTSDGKINRRQTNVIKTMIVISVTYSVTSFCEIFGYVTWSFNEETAMYSHVQDTVYVGLYFVNVWLDPFIYIISNRDVRQKCLRYLRDVIVLVTRRKNGDRVGSIG